MWVASGSHSSDTHTHTQLPESPAAPHPLPSIRLMNYTDSHTRTPTSAGPPCCKFYEIQRPRVPWTIMALFLVLWVTASACCERSCGVPTRANEPQLRHTHSHTQLPESPAAPHPSHHFHWKIPWILIPEPQLRMGRPVVNSVRYNDRACRG